MSSLPGGYPGAPISIVPSGQPQQGSQAVPVSVPMSSGQGLLPTSAWLVAFVVLAGGLLVIADSDKYGEIASALAVLIAVGAFTWQYQAIFQEIDKVFGTTLSTQFSAGPQS